MKNVKQGNDCPVVCLDAGHYGKYNRSPANPSLYESEFNWKIQNLLALELETYGIKVIKTRSEAGKDMDLVARGEASKGCDLFLSLHANASDNPKADYVLGIYMIDDDCGAIDEQSKQLSKLLSDPVAEILDTTAVTWNRASAKDRDGNGHMDDYYGVLRGAHNVGTAGVILEHGFYTNPWHAQLLQDDAVILRLVKAEGKVLADWFGITERIGGNPYIIELRSLKKGSKGERVEALQAMLIAKGYSCGETGVDGSFGALTDKALRAYQSDMELEVDGSAGPMTMLALLGYR